MWRLRNKRYPRGFAICVCFVCLGVPGWAQSYRDIRLPRPLPLNSYLVVGVTGGFERWNSPNRPVRRLALDLQGGHHPNVYVVTIEHWHPRLALRVIRECLDQNKDGRIDDQERASVKLILYGHSMGGAAVVKLARQLKRLGVPVLLTLQVDSVGKSDRIIPDNVLRAANFFQHSSHLIRGRSDIRAEDPAKTNILGNFEYDYKDSKIDLSQASVLERITHGAHAKMEFDPEVWTVVKSLILEEIR